MAKGPRWATVWITGGASGIGRAMALQLAEQGSRVIVSSRNPSSVSGLHPNIVTYTLDVTDAAAVATAVREIEHAHGVIDLAVFAAAAYAPADLARIDPRAFLSMMTVNYMGVVNGLAALVPVMQQRRTGHIAWFASVAGYRGLPKASAYGPTKAALINLAESVKPDLARAGIAVSVVNPGFVATPLTSGNDFPMPFLMQPDEAARLTIRGLAARRFEIAYPWQFVSLLKMARLLPYGFYFRLIERFVLKAST